MAIAVSRVSPFDNQNLRSMSYGEARRLSLPSNHNCAAVDDLRQPYTPCGEVWKERIDRRQPGVSHQQKASDCQPQTQRAHFEPSEIPLGGFETTNMSPTPPHSQRISEHGMISLLEYSPAEGEGGVPIVVTVELRSGARQDDAAYDPAIPSNYAQESLRLRIVLGRAALSTTVTVLQVDMRHNDSSPGVQRLRVRSVAPSYKEVGFPEGTSVPLHLQVISADTVIDALFVGSFTYWKPSVPATIVLPQLKRHRDDCDNGHITSEDSYNSSLSINHSRKRMSLGDGRAQLSLSLIRTSAADGRDGNAEAYPASIEWTGDPGTAHPGAMIAHWTSDEKVTGRRLVLFRRELQGGKLLVSCEPVAQEEYDDREIVISCIYRDDTKTHWFTSVDVIYLLERFVGNPFTVEEKNRIRRNLEGLKPTTISKHKPGYAAFFQRIMDFPPPKPRNIEKDVKVFPWSALTGALDKIISKYSAFALSPSSSQSPRELSQSPPDFSPRTRNFLSDHDQSLLQSNYTNGYPVLSANSFPSTAEQIPLQHYQAFLGPPEHYDDAWQRRASLASVSTDGYYSEGAVSDHLNNQPLQTHVPTFSNPIDVTSAKLNLDELALLPQVQGELSTYNHLRVPMSALDAMVAGPQTVPPNFYSHTRNSSDASSYEAFPEMHQGPHDQGTYTGFPADALDPSLGHYSMGNREF